MRQKLNLRVMRGEKSHLMPPLEWSKIRSIDLEKQAALKTQVTQVLKENRFDENEIPLLIDLTAPTIQECCLVQGIDSKNVELSFFIDSANKRGKAAKSKTEGVFTIKMNIHALNHISPFLSDLIKPKNILEKLLPTESDKQIRKLIFDYLNTLAHESYHVRQGIHSPEYFDSTSISQKEIDATKQKAYFGKQGEQGARGFALRYLQEKKKMLERKKDLTPLEKVILQALKENLTSEEAQVKKEAAYGREK